MTAELEGPRAPQIARGRGLLAVVVVAGHAVKHVFNSGMRSLLLPEIKIGLGLSGSRFGALLTASQITSWGTTIGAGYLGDRFSNRAALMLGISLAMTGISFFIAGHATTYAVMFLAMLSGRHGTRRSTTHQPWASCPVTSPTSGASPYRFTAWAATPARC